MPTDSLDPSFEPIAWRGGMLRFLDQTLLPAAERYVDTHDYRAVCDAIRRLAVRGAPLIGIAGAYGLALAAQASEDIAGAAEEIAATRPTAVNLRWAVERALRRAAEGTAAVLDEARRIHEEQAASDRRSGALGAELIEDGATVLTHCNTGSLATGGIGSALGVIKTAHAQGKRIEVLADETRPLLQGARLTAWELSRAGIPHRVIADGAAAGIIARGGVQAIFVGADRIAATGDTANKVGTYGLALAARAHGVPFYAVAPVSTIDPVTPSGAGIAIEERAEDEVLTFASARTAPAGARALNPAFDVTPAALIAAIITERGVLRVPYGDAIARAVQAAAGVR
jgi:methylthioribose-1-phosphate isomerase